MQLVAADIGGTHARFALAEVEGGNVVALGEPTTMRTADHASFEAAWHAYARQLARALPRAAAVAVAGPVRGAVLQLTNNPWTIRPSALAEQLGLDTHVLVNDFEAVGHAVARVDPAHLRHLAGPDLPLAGHGTITVVGPGTGLGVAQVHRSGGATTVLPCEGGHIDFAPLDAVEDALLAVLRKRFGRVSVERIVSGPGLAAIHDLLAGDAPQARDDQALWTAALSGNDPLAAVALDRFCLCLGSVAGDLALAHGASAVVIAGGLGLRLADHLPHSGFAERFAAKGRFSDMLSALPVKLITHPQPGLFGAAAAFARSHPC